MLLVSHLGGRIKIMPHCLHASAGARVTNATLQLLAQIASLTHLVLVNSQGFSAAGLQHLRNLRNLQNLEFYSCRGMAGASFSALAQLKTLTSLTLHDCDVQGRTLAQLSALSRLQKLALPFFGRTGPEAQAGWQGREHLKAVERFTSLTKLEMPDAAISDDCKGILELPHLQELSAYSIDVPQEELFTSMCSKLTSLTLGTFRRIAATLLPLPELQRLEFRNIASPGMPGRPA